MSYKLLRYVLFFLGIDCNIKLWDFAKLQEDASGEDVNISHNPDVRNGEPYLLRSFQTKNSPVIATHFTRRNLLMAVGTFHSQTTT